MLDTASIKQDFPILDQFVHDELLVYLDSAATSQKPLRVLEAVRDYYHEDNANVHRGVHCLGERATQADEEAKRRPLSKKEVAVSQRWRAIGDKVLKVELPFHKGMK